MIIVRILFLFTDFSRLNKLHMINKLYINNTFTQKTCRILMKMIIKCFIIIMFHNYSFLDTNYVEKF